MLSMNTGPNLPTDDGEMHQKFCEWDLFEKFQFQFFAMQNFGLFLQILTLLFCSSSIFLTFWIELMFPKDGQILVDDFRHQNFGIWTFLVEVMVILVKNVCKIIELHCKRKNYLTFSLKWP